MEELHNDMNPGGQIIFSPSRNPYEVLPGFIKGWAITDTVFAGIWCAAALAWWTLAICLLGFGHTSGDDLLFFILGLSSAIAGGFGLYTNILLLSKKPRAVVAGRCLIAITILRILWNMFLSGVTVYLLFPQFQLFLLAVCVLVTGGRITLLVFYWMAVSRAARYFEARKKRIGF